jgi:hypothetical protein
VEDHQAWCRRPRRDSGLDLAASACPVVDLSVAVAGTGLAHQMA